MVFININELDNVYLGKIKYLDGFDEKGTPIFKKTSRYYLFERVKADDIETFREFLLKSPISLDIDSRANEFGPTLTDLIKFSKEFPDIKGGDYLSLLILMDEYNNNLEKQAKKELLP